MKFAPKKQQDIFIPWICLDQARPRHIQGAFGGWPGTERGPPSGASGWSVVTGGGVRRRSRETAARPKVVQFSLTYAEFGEISEAAASAGLARGAFAAEEIG